MFSHHIGWSFAVEFIGLLSILYITIFGLVSKSSWGERLYNEIIFWMALVALLVMLFALYVTEICWHLQQMDFFSPFYENDLLISNLFLALVKGFILLLIIFCLILHRPFFREEEIGWEYPLFLILICLAMFWLISGKDLFIVYIALELQSLSLYIIAGMKRYSNLAVEATIKLFFLSSFASASFLFGLSLLYATFGTTNIGELAILFYPTTLEYELEGFNSLFSLSILAISLLLVGLLFKLAAVPYYFWVGDVFQGNFGYFGSFLAIVTKLPTFIVFIKLWYWALVPLLFPFSILIQYLAVFSLLVGSLYALTELRFKRFWALGAVTQMGNILLAISLGSAEGLAASWFFFIIYLLCTVFMWGVIMHLFRKPEREFTLNEFLIQLARFTTLKTTHLGYTIAIVFVLFSMAGVPPGVGFLPKALIIYRLFENGDLFVAAIVFFIQLISIAYYLRIARFLLFEAHSNLLKEVQIDFQPLDKWVAYLLVAIFVINLLFVYYFVEILFWLQLWAVFFINSLF